MLPHNALKIDMDNFIKNNQSLNFRNNKGHNLHGPIFGGLF